MNCCGQQFCEHCLEKWLLKNKTCPHCRSANFSHIFMHPTSRKIGNLKVYCPNKQHGCKVALKISEYEQHLSTTDDRGCLYVKLKCQNNCTAEVFRGEMLTHIWNECPKRLVACSLCSLVGDHDYITGDHVDECPSHPLLCSRGCIETVLRKNLQAHQDVCPLEPVLCPFREMGCKTVLVRKELAQHMENNALQHMTTLAKSYTALKEDYTAMKESYSAKMKAIGPIVKHLQLDQDNSQVAQICTILADPSYVKLRDSVNLVLSESNDKSGSHHFILEHPHSPAELKFKLVWQMEEAPVVAVRRRKFGRLQSPKEVDHTKPLSYTFQLYSTTKLRKRLCNVWFGIDIDFIGGFEQKPSPIASICCGNPQNVPDAPGDGSGELIGMVTLDCQQKILKQMKVRFFGKHRFTDEGCYCRCHYVPPYPGYSEILGK